MIEPVIDVHTHLVPDLAAAVDGLSKGADGCWVVDGHRVGVPGLYDAARLASSLAEYGVDAAWVSAPPPMYRQGQDAAATRRWADALDEGMRRRIAGHTGLSLLSYLPLDQPEVAFEVARGLLGANDVRCGWTASAGGGSVSLAAPELEPLWQLLEDADQPLLLHPGESPDARLEPLYLSNLLGNPVETAVAAAQLVLGGVLERHPRLKIVLVHCGGVVPAVVGRWARGVATARPGVPADGVDPIVTVRRLWVDTLAHSPELLELAGRVFGDDKLVLGSDYPFPMGVDHPLDSIAHLDPERRAAIGRNAAVLLSKGPAA